MPLLFSNRCIRDDAGERLPVTGKFSKTLNPMGFSIGRPDDPPRRQVVNFLLGVVSFALIAATFFAPFALVQIWGIPGFFVAFALAWLSFHQIRLIFSLRADEYELEMALPRYRAEHPDSCPACDHPLGDVWAGDAASRSCPACGGVWHRVE